MVVIDGPRPQRDTTAAAPLGICRMIGTQMSVMTLYCNDSLCRRHVTRGQGVIPPRERCPKMHMSISSSPNPSVSQTDHVRESEQVHDQHSSGGSTHSHTDGPAAVFTASTSTPVAGTYDASGRLSASNNAVHSPSDGHSSQQHRSASNSAAHSPSDEHSPQQHGAV